MTSLQAMANTVYLRQILSDELRKHLKLIARVVLQLQTKDTFPKGYCTCHLINHISSLQIRRHL